jgi:hypothetical protein
VITAIPGESAAVVPATIVPDAAVAVEAIADVTTTSTALDLAWFSSSS